MRVAYVIPHLRTPSGWRTASIGIIRAMQQYANVEPVVVVSKIDEKAANEFLPEYDRITLPEIQYMSFDRPGTWPKLARTWLQSKNLRLSVDLVHSLDAYSTGLVGHWLAKTLNVPHVLTALGTYAVKWHSSFCDRRVYKQILRQSAFICPMSNMTYRLMQQYFGDALLQKSHQVVLLGTNYSQQISRSMAFQHIPDNIPTLLSVGAVKPRKGYHLSLAAFAKIKAQLPTSRYWIVGNIDNSAYHAELQQFINENHLTDVEFLGNVSEKKLQECYRRASAFVLTPQMEGLYFEGFGLVYLEAGAYGLPTIGTKIGGGLDAIKHGITGLLAEKGDIDGVANAMLQLLTNRELARQLGCANRDWSEYLTWERFAQEQFQIYKQVSISD